MDRPLAPNLSSSSVFVDPLELPATTQRVRLAAKAARMSDGARDRALGIATSSPTAAEWRGFLSRALALLGVGLLLAGIVCFVAYNWARFGRFAKFGVIEAAIIAATLVGWRKLPGLPGQVALFAAAVLIGPLLAVYGQTYQTGADPYGLFLTWLVVIIPWVIAARFAVLWIFALGLLDVAVVLFLAQVIGMNDLSEALVPPLLIAAFHATAVAAWEWQIRRTTPWLDEGWSPKVVAPVGLVALLIAASVFVLGRSTLTGAIGVAGLAAAIAGALHYYRHVRPDRFMVTIAVATGMAWVAVCVGRVIFDELDLGVMGFLMMAAFVVLEITVGLSWFRGSRGTSPAAES